MEPESYYFLEHRQDLWTFIRRNPEWYRYLTRDTERINEIDQLAKQYFGKTIPQRLEKAQHNIQLVRMLIDMAGAFRD
ncbi:YlbE-like protein [Gracilibacillus ureilyticus]|uniref:YlbE-like protein n=1 Tax=Gracilibacillus ureilyticus TaxID=531814 RepID=A0A1H9TJ83_9BACI|nr:YlbE-like family protein [Gracilibacillus ureilyticus]SER96919.1 YlbE-like protein [Gracilibacillus ureilyticus]